MSQASSIFFLYWRRGFFISKKRFFFLEKKAFLFSSKKRILFFYWKTGFYFLLKKGFSYPRNELLLYKTYFQLQSIFCVSTTKKNSQEINSLYIYMFQRILNHKEFCQVLYTDQARSFVEKWHHYNSVEIFAMSSLWYSYCHKFWINFWDIFFKYLYPQK